MKYIKRFESKNEILPYDSLTFPNNPIKLNGVLDWYNSKKQGELWEFLDKSLSEELIKSNPVLFTNLFGEEGSGKIKCSLEDALNDLEKHFKINKIYSKWSRDEIELFTKYVREYGI